MFLRFNGKIHLSCTTSHRHFIFIKSVFYSWLIVCRSCNSSSKNFPNFAKCWDPKFHLAFLTKMKIQTLFLRQIRVRQDRFSKLISDAQQKNRGSDDAPFQSLAHPIL